MDFNKYLSTIEDLHLDTYPKEVLDDFFEFINSVPFIRNIISSTRPTVAQCPRDSEGRAIIDLTNPPIIEDTDYFRPTALHFKEYGTMCSYRPNPNPTSSYGKWVREEIRRCFEGYVREKDGAWVTGDMYFYLNYCPIILSKIRPGTKIADRIVDFPEFWEGIFWRFHYIELARVNAKHAAEIAKRGASKSYSMAAILAKLFVLGENSTSYKNVRGVITAYQKEYLTKDGTLNKFVEMIDFIALNTLFPSKRLKDSLLDMQWKMGYKDLKTGALKGSLNEIIGVSAKDDPDKLRGKRANKIIIEEFGNFPRIVDTYRVLLPSVQEGDIAFGQILEIGTGGSEGADFAGALEILYNPAGFNILSVSNVFDKSALGKADTIFFFGAYINRKGCYNQDGISDVTKAILELCHNRYIVKYNTFDSMALTRTKAENPITIQEAIMRRDSTIFPVSDLRERIDLIDSNPNFYDGTYVGDLVLKNGQVDFSLSNDLPIRKFPHKDNKIPGAIEIFEMPLKDATGRVFSNRYFLSSDPYDQDSSDTMSLGSTLVLDMWTDEIVAEYTGRPMFSEDYYEICRKMCLFYNGKLNYENNKRGLFSYFSKMNCLYLLCDTPLYLKDKQLIKITGYGNSSKGVTATASINNYARTLIRDWLLKPVTTIVGETETTIPNLYRIKNRALLEELAQWNSDGNYDRVSSLGMLMLIREEQMILYQGDSSKAKNTIDINAPENDEFFQENFDKRFS